VGILHRFDRVFRRKPSHYQGQLAIGCRLDRKPVYAQYILRSVSATAVHFHNKLDVFHDSFQILARDFRSVLSVLTPILVGLSLQSVDPQPTSVSKTQSPLRRREDNSQAG
jgi:hypothetical protein